MHFTVASPAQYQAAQVDAMVRHMGRTPALDTVIVAAHDADGRPTFTNPTLTMEHMQ